MKKYVLISILILFLTGCSVKYDLIIDKDLSIKESANMTGTASFFNVYNRTKKIDSINMILDNNKYLLDNNNYHYEVINDKIPYVIADKEYNSLEDFTNNSIFYQEYFEKIKYTVDNNVIKIESVGFDPIDPDNPERFNIKDLTIGIKSYYKVLSHNGFKYDERTNTCYWKISDDTDEFELNLEIDKDKRFIPYLNIYIYSAIAIGVIAIIWIIAIYFDKKEKNERKNKN